MNQNYQLCSPWCVWLSFYLVDSGSTRQDYTNKLKKLHTFRTTNDLIYFWQESRFKNIREFFVQSKDEVTNNLTKFQIDGKAAGSINAINYFREGIDPTWEDVNNKQGGRLLFQIDKDISKYQEIYEWLIFYFLGDNQILSEDINGIRFISHKANAPFKFHYRVEVWTKFNSNETKKLDSLRDSFFKDFLQQNPNLKSTFNITFKDNKEQKGNTKKKEEQQKPKA